MMKDGNEMVTRGEKKERSDVEKGKRGGDDLRHTPLFFPSFGFVRRNVLRFKSESW